MLIPGSRTSLDFARDWESNILDAREREASGRRSRRGDTQRAVAGRIARFFRRRAGEIGELPGPDLSGLSVREAVDEILPVDPPLLEPEAEPGSAPP